VDFLRPIQVTAAIAAIAATQVIHLIHVAAIDRPGIDSPMVIATDRRYLEFEIAEDVYSMECVKKSCYALMGIGSSEIRTSTDGKILVKMVILPEVNQSDSDLRQLLFDELLDYSLRESIFEQTEGVRNVILANAFSRSRLIG